MPWCDHCDRYLAPAAVDAEGRCQFCGRVASGEEPSGPRAETSSKQNHTNTHSAPRGPEKPPLPWHFKVLAVVGSAYLLTRLVQGVGWITDHL